MQDGGAGFGIPKRTQTPEPWVRRLADDGMSYYYVNKYDGQISWTVPESGAPPSYTDDGISRELYALIGPSAPTLTAQLAKPKFKAKPKLSGGAKAVKW